MYWMGLVKQVERYSWRVTWRGLALRKKSEGLCLEGAGAFRTRGREKATKVISNHAEASFRCQPEGYGCHPIGNGEKMWASSCLASQPCCISLYCVTLGKSPDLVGPQFLCLKIRGVDNNSIYLIEVLWGLWYFIKMSIMLPVTYVVLAISF